MPFNTFVTAAILATMGMAPGTAIPVRNSTDAAIFEINTGNNGEDDVVWISGQSKCNNVVLGPFGANPCHRPFTLNGISGLTLEGCGNGLWVNKDGNFWANCAFLSEPDDCRIMTSFHCA